MARLTDIGWNEFHALPLEAKRPYLERVEGEGMPYHTLFAQQFDRPILERLCALANRIRFINKSKEGVFSWWNGQHALADPPACFTWIPYDATRSARSILAFISSMTDSVIPVAIELGYIIPQAPHLCRSPP